MSSAGDAKALGRRGALSAATVFHGGMPPGEAYEVMGAARRSPLRPASARAPRPALPHAVRRCIASEGGSVYGASPLPPRSAQPVLPRDYVLPPAVSPRRAEVADGGDPAAIAQRIWTDTAHRRRRAAPGADGAPRLAVALQVDEPPPPPPPLQKGLRSPRRCYDVWEVDGYREVDGDRAALHSNDHIRDWSVSDPWQLRRLQRFLQHYAPEHLRNATEIMEQWRGYEETLFRRLRAQFGAEPPYRSSAGPDAGTLPPGWRRVRDGHGDIFFEHTDGRAQWQPPVDL
eukprot:TRINITY_DN4052_c0_g1_i1.p1 TRINITY_DN4052_c0_g1~~TRINITY_DN4052_c0_g1_i1.p1  ORF type:complete len:310 (+),score=66.08 TRINITY_DN4052_c0_g1_i1:71-931(+)